MTAHYPNEVFSWFQSITQCPGSYHRHLAATHRAEMASKLKFLKWVAGCTSGMVRWQHVSLTLSFDWDFQEVDSGQTEATWNCHLVHLHRTWVRHANVIAIRLYIRCFERNIRVVTSHPRHFFRKCKKWKEIRRYAPSMRPPNPCKHVPLRFLLNQFYRIQFVAVYTTCPLILYLLPFTRTHPLSQLLHHRGVRWRTQLRQWKNFAKTNPRSGIGVRPSSTSLWPSAQRRESPSPTTSLSLMALPSRNSTTAMFYATQHTSLGMLCRELTIHLKRSVWLQGGGPWVLEGRRASMIGWGFGLKGWWHVCT